MTFRRRRFPKWSSTTPTPEIPTTRRWSTKTWTLSNRKIIALIFSCEPFSSERTPTSGGCTRPSSWTRPSSAGVTTPSWSSSTFQDRQRLSTARTRITHVRNIFLKLMINNVWLFVRHGVPGGPHRRPWARADGEGRRQRSDHHLLLGWSPVSIWVTCQNFPSPVLPTHSYLTVTLPSIKDFMFSVLRLKVFYIRSLFTRTFSYCSRAFENCEIWIYWKSCDQKKWRTMISTETL